jgi:beta-fructofuranosidase
MESQNFEVANVFTLSETGYGNGDVAVDFFTTIGTEGGDYPVEVQTSPNHDMLWINGNVTKSENGIVHFEPTMAGVLDWGIQSYAAAGKILPASSQASKNSGTTVDRFLSYLWLTNDDYGQSQFPVQQQGWDGTLLTARELSKGTIKNVVDNSLVHEKASWQVTARNESAGTVELTTLQQKVVREVYSASIKNATNVHHQPATKVKTSKDLDVSPDSKFFVLRTSIDFPTSARNDSSVKAGFKILASEYESTSIYYRKRSHNLQTNIAKSLTFSSTEFSNESLIIDRSNSSAAEALTPGITKRGEVGKLRLFDIHEPSSDESKIETLDLTVIVDNSVVEVWANDRFVMSTWVWYVFSSPERLRGNAIV